MNRRAPLVALVAVVLSLASCAGTVTVSTGAAVVGEPLRDTAWVLVWGLAGDDVNVPAHNGAARVEVERGLLGYIVGLLTVGLVQPMSVEVWPVLDARGTGSNV